MSSFLQNLTNPFNSVVGLKIGKFQLVLKSSALSLHFRYHFAIE
jgi:hypothetical protein